MENIFDLTKPIAIGADHAGFEYKSVIVEMLTNKGLQVKDLALTAKTLWTTLTLRTRWPMR